MTLPWLDPRDPLQPFPPAEQAMRRPNGLLAEVLPQTSDELDLLDARIGATFGSLDFELFGLNLTDENASIDPYQGWANANRTRPRLIGLKLGYQF